jgi:hypothetical protein
MKDKLFYHLYNKVKKKVVSHPIAIGFAFLNHGGQKAQGNTESSLCLAVSLCHRVSIVFQIR